ncbi:MAG: GGDEF domain-containing protein [Rhodocyclaceae bacterium]|nr:GGDEF domain-containing protein [Rhodocyclaceae bacterium]MCA3088605.1 GGDEF domain-containing protein [Rhodocyclaceae bacterium]MCA3092611.1 GGDEF domain-containing protein [Rhodocyclaceae bacterium]MCA3098602.1 GGDEF domain-containing protein [Rhodocyclaceae bacterium]MCA3102194.1 GGDEF domain-containing protein [Rhodocyclaceae bacterium]
MTPTHIATSLVTRFIAVGLVLLIVGSIASYYRITGFLREDLGQSVAASQRAMADQVARTAEARIDERRQLLERLATALPPIQPGQPERLRAWLAAQHALQTAFSPGLLVADPAGRILARGPSTATFPAGPDIGTDPGFRAALEGGTALGQPQRDAATGHAVLPIATPVWDGNGQRIAVLVGITDLATLAPLGNPATQPAAAGWSHDIVIVSPRDQRVVAAADPARLLQTVAPAGPDTPAGPVAPSLQESGRTVDADGIDQLWAIAAVGGTGWYASVRQPASEALAPVEHTQAFLIQLTLVRSVLVLILVGLVIAWLLRPLHRAARLAEQMTLGEQPLRPLPVAHADEVGHLTTAFNRLIGTLADKQAELEAMAFLDTLTGLPNRKLLVDRTIQALARAERNQTRIALLFLDLDGFKVINDTQGHEAGDEVLREVARRLSRLIRQADTLARLGGDEFVLLAPDNAATGDAPIQALADKCLDAIARPIEWKGFEHRLRVSIGIAVSRTGDDPDSLIAAADAAMYEVKRGGGGGYAQAARGR